MITKDELRAVQTDPIAAVSLMFNRLEESDTDIMNIDPSNPFAFTMETIAFNSSVLRDEINTKYGRLFTRLANNDSDLFTNMSYTDYKNIFSQPANATIRFFINVTDFETNAIVVDGYKMVSIPELSTLTVEGFNFLITNQIDIKQFENGTFSIEQNVSTLEIGVGVLGVLQYKIVTDENSNRILIFDTILKQISMENKTYVINKTETYNESITLLDKLHYITAYTTNGSVVKDIEVSYSEIIDPNRPTILVRLLRTGIEIVVPDAYILNNSIRGKLHVNIFTTKGNVDFPLDKISNKEFKLIYSNTTVSAFTAAINNINITNTALYRLTGGSDAKSFDVLRDSIISNSIGDVLQPITKAQIVDSLSRSGFHSYLLEDSITNRLFIASKSLPINKSDNSSPDVLFYKTKMISGDYVGHPKISISGDNEDRLVVKPYTPFKNVNGVVEPLTIDELSVLNNMSDSTLMNYLNNNDILYSPYAYVSSITDGVYGMRVVDYTPRVDSFTIRHINANTTNKINIAKHGIVVTDKGYRVSLLMSTNGELDKINPLLIKGQLRLRISDDVYIYYNSNFNNKMFTFDIDTDFYIDNENLLWITNGISDLPTKIISLDNTVELITYIDSPGTEIETNNYINKLVRTDRSVVALTLEDINIVFGTLVDDIHRNLSIGYTNRKYLTYNEDIFAVYDEDVYDTDTLGSLFTPNDDHTDLDYTLLHSKGDNILDDNGMPIILHRRGDTILDGDDMPIIDRLDGVVKYTDMTMFEYGDYVVNNKNDDIVVSTISSYLEDIANYKTLLLEETNLAFKPFRNNNSVKIRLNKSFTLVHRPIRPMVELFIESDVKVVNNNPLELQTEIGRIIHKWINNETFYVADIKEEIMNTVNIAISAIRLNLDRNIGSPLSTLEKIILFDNTNRLRIQKTVVNTLGYLSSTYDVEVKITRI